MTQLFRPTTMRTPPPCPTLSVTLQQSGALVWHRRARGRETATVENADDARLGLPYEFSARLVLDARWVCVTVQHECLECSRSYEEICFRLQTSLCTIELSNRHYEAKARCCSLVGLDISISGYEGEQGEGTLFAESRRRLTYTQRG